MKNKFLIIALLLTSFTVLSNLPPTSSKVSGDATGVTTFNFEFPNFTGTHNGSTVTLGTLSVAGGGTGSASQNFVDLTTPQSIAGVKTFSDNIAGNITGNAATVTTNANLTGMVTSVGNATTVVTNANLSGDVTSSGNVTSYNSIVPISKGGTGSATQNFVDLTTTQTVAGAKTLSNDLTIATDITLSGAQFNNVKFGHMAAHLISTGVSSGGNLSIDTDTTKWDMAIQELGFSNYTVDSNNPVIKEVTCPALNAQAVTNLAVADNTYILVDDSCAVTQQTTYPTPQEQRLKAFIGRLNHTSRTAVDSVFTTPTFTVAPLSQYNDLLDALGPFNMSGNIVTPNGANLSINRSAGTIFRRGLNYVTDDQNPHGKTYVSATAGAFFRSTQTAVGTSTFTTLNVSNYDLAGTVTAMPGGGGTATNQRIFLLASGNMAVQYGQVIYSSLANAVAGIPNEAFTINPTIANAGVLVGVVSCRKDATNASLVAQCVFSKVSRFDSSGVSVGSNSVATLQSAYDNSVTPQITTSTLLGSVDIKRGSAADTDNVLRLQNGAGSDVVKATGNGRVDTRYSSPNNMLNNGDVEFTDISMFTCTVGTCTRTTSAGEYSSGAAALKVALSAQSMDVSQTITTPSGIQKQGIVGFIYRIPATGIVTPTVTVTVDSVLQVTVPTDKLIMDGLFHPLEVPILFGATDIKLSFLSGSSTGSVFFDGVYVKQGIGFQNLQLDDVYSANVSAAGVVSGENKTGWVTCGAPTSGASTCTFTSGVFSVIPNCWGASANSSSERSVGVTETLSNTSVLVTSSAGTGTNDAFSLYCQKSGNDYLAASAQVYSQASGNTDWASYTPTITGFGTPTAVAAEWRRTGDSIEIRGTFTSGTSTAVEGRFSLPNGLTISGVASLPTIRPAGVIANAFNGEGSYFLLMEPSTTYVTFGRQSSTSAGITKLNGSAFLGSGNQIYFNSLLIPIASQSSSNVIVGSFENVPTVPGAGKKIDIFSVSYGTTNESTVCSASPCSYLDQIGTAVTSITTSGAGLYTLNTGKTYTKLKCVIAAYRTVFPTSPYMCSNCSSLPFNTENNAGTATNSYGTLNCMGSY